MSRQRTGWPSILEDWSRRWSTMGRRSTRAPSAWSTSRTYGQENRACFLKNPTAKHMHECGETLSPRNSSPRFTLASWNNARKNKLQLSNKFSMVCLSFPKRWMRLGHFFMVIPWDTLTSCLHRGQCGSPLPWRTIEVLMYLDHVNTIGTTSGSMQSEHIMLWCRPPRHQKTSWRCTRSMLLIALPPKWHMPSAPERPCLEEAQPEIRVFSELRPQTLSSPGRRRKSLGTRLDIQSPSVVSLAINLQPLTTGSQIFRVLTCDFEVGHKKKLCQSHSSSFPRIHLSFNWYLPWFPAAFSCPQINPHYSEYPWKQTSQTFNRVVNAQAFQEVFGDHKNGCGYTGVGYRIKYEGVIVCNWKPGCILTTDYHRYHRFSKVLWLDITLNISKHIGGVVFYCAGRWIKLMALTAGQIAQWQHCA